MTAKLTSEQSNQLFQSYQQGDSTALDALYRQWQPHVKRRIQRSKAFLTYEVDDIASEVWILVQEHAHKWDLDKAGWFRFLDYRIKAAIDRQIRHRQAQKRQAHTTAISLDDYLDDPDKKPLPLFADDPHPADYLIFQERVQLVQDAIMACAFPEAVLMILDLRLADQDYAEIAARVGMEKREVANTLARAITTIRQHLRARLTE